MDNYSCNSFFCIERKISASDIVGKYCNGGYNTYTELQNKKEDKVNHLNYRFTYKLIAQIFFQSTIFAAKTRVNQTASFQKIKFKLKSRRKNTCV